jgi:glutamyl-tRNA synthetase
MGVDGPLFDVLKIDNICKDRLSRLNKNQISELALTWAKEYDEDFANLINRDYNYFTQIMNIEREIERPRKDYTRFSDIKNSIMFFYDDLYQEMLANSSELPFNPSISKEDTISVLKTFLLKNKMDEGESEWFNNLKEIGASLGFAANNKEYKANKEAYKGHIGDVAQILRIALTTKTQTPNLYNILEILGEDRYTSRINNIIDLLSK